MRERRETEKVIFVLIKCTKENKDSLYIENEKKQSCKQTADKNTYNKNYIKLNTTLTRQQPKSTCVFSYRKYVLTTNFKNGGISKTFHNAHRQNYYCN